MPPSDLRNVRLRELGRGICFPTGQREREREREKGEKIGALLSREPICRVGRRAGLPHGTERKEGRKEGRKKAESFNAGRKLQ